MEKVQSQQRFLQTHKKVTSRSPGRSPHHQYISPPFLLLPLWGGAHCLPHAGSTKRTGVLLSPSLSPPPITPCLPLQGSRDCLTFWIQSLHKTSGDICLKRKWCCCLRITHWPQLAARPPPPPHYHSQLACLLIPQCAQSFPSLSNYIPPCFVHPQFMIDGQGF